MGRAPCCEKVGLKKGRWTTDEDEILIKYIQANGEGSWRSLPKNAGLLRCGKSCRLRWINYLRAGLKRGNVSPQEEDVIIRLHASLGNRWSSIASRLPGRTDNEIKNYWNSHLSRRIDTFGRVTSISDTAQMITDVHIITTESSPPKRRGGKTSRWAMKKNICYRKQRGQKRSTVSVINKKEAVPVPTTPALENEILSTAIEDFMALEAEQVDKRSESETRVTCCDQGFKSSTCSSEGLQLEEAEDIDGRGVLCIDDLFDHSWLLDDGGGVSSLSDETDNDELVGVVGKAEESDIGRVDNSYPTKMAASEELGTEKRGQSSHEEWFSSCSSVTTSVFDDNWDVDWDGVSQLESRDESWLADKEKLLSWLWEDDHDWESTENQNLQSIDPEKHNAMVAWFLS